MEYAELGHSGIKVSRLCVGCMSFGKVFPDFHQWVLNQEQTDSVVKYALEKGINFFDTANCYSHGTSEEFLGNALKKFTARDKVVIATKVYFNEGKLTRKAILTECDASLKRLGTDYIDLYIIHRFDYGTPVEETMEALDSLVKAGKVRALGASAMYAYQFYTMQVEAEKNGWTQFTSMQNHYNAIYREDEREMIPLCRQMNVALTPYSPLAAGRLSRSEWKTDSARSRTDTTAAEKYDSTEEQDKKIALRIQKTAEKYGTSMTAVALSWLFAKGVTSALIGATKTEHFDGAASSFSLKLTDEDIKNIDELYIPHKIVGAL